MGGWLVFAAAGMGKAAPALRDYHDFAMKQEGDAAKGRGIFNELQRSGCVRCHSVDGSGGKAGPDLFAIGDKLPRAELIRSVLEPSASIAVGYGTTIIDTITGAEFVGVVKSAGLDGVELIGGDGKRVRVAAGDIKSQHGSKFSLMPDALQAGLSLPEFADLIEYLASLRQAESSLAANRGMPENISALAQPIVFRPFLNSNVCFPEGFVAGGGDVTNGLVWFGQLPGERNVFLAVHQTGRIWRIEKSGTNETRSLFLDISKEIFNERGPNGLVCLAFHPHFPENQKYYLKHQVFEEGKILTTVVERQAKADLSADSGLPSRRVWQVATTTQDHTGGCIAFGPDGFLYIGMGDTGPQEDPQGHGQDLRTPLGKMLRIDINHRDADLGYAIPRDNPFLGAKMARPEIWAYGLREPWRFSFDPVTGELWVGDVGQDRVEEVSVVRRGENYGWNVYEGFEPFSNKYRREGENYAPPVFAYRRKFGASVTGGCVYRGDKNSSFYGVYIFADYVSRRVFGLKAADRKLDVVRQIATAPDGITSFGTDENGEIYAVGYAGMVYHLELAGTDFAR